MYINLTSSQNTFQYHIIGIINGKIVPILIDTGAAWSHISKNLCSNIQDLNEPRTIIRFDNSEKELKQQTRILLKLQEIEPITLDVIVDEEPNKFLLGIDFLEQVRFIITDEYILINGGKQPRYKLSEETIINSLN